MNANQSTFRSALLEPDRDVPTGLVDGVGAPAGKRFDVYRNNVIVSLTEALAIAFPLVRKLIGAEKFARLAQSYVRAQPPTSPVLMLYGDTFADFLADFEPLSHIGYLADCARLDLALRQSYHAADSAAFDPSVLETDPERLMKTKLALAPATRILRSLWPLFDIWRFNTEPGSPAPVAVAQDVLITRPDYDPLPHALPPGGATWLNALDSGQDFEAATAAAEADCETFDLAATLTLALTSGAFSTPKPRMEL